MPNQMDQLFDAGVTHHIFVGENFNEMYLNPQEKKYVLSDICYKSSFDIIWMYTTRFLV